MNKMSTKKYAFVLGRERDLALAELRAVLNRFGFCFSDLILTNNVAIYNLDKSPRSVIEILGGTTKIFEVIETESDLKSQIKNIITERARDGGGKFTFGFSAYNRHHSSQLNALGLNIKKELKKEHSLRFVAGKDRELSTIVSAKNKLASKSGLEIGFFDNFVGILIGVTDSEAWSKRDYDKPASDKFSGMVPPKLARMMINLALGVQSGNEDKVVLFDPFCGSGNVLLEAAMLRIDAVGSDISEKAVRDSQINLEWLCSESKSTVFRADATNYNFEDDMKKYEYAVIVTEPFLGEPKKFMPTMNSARGEYSKLKQIYLDFFTNIARLKNSGKPIVLCVIFPLVETVGGSKYSLYSETVDEIRKIGYTEFSKPLVYGRDYQVVKREIVLLKF